MAFNPGDVLPTQHDIGYVVLSYTVAVLGSLLALYHVNHIRRADGTTDRSMLVGAAVALGGIGIWSMHFIGMLGFKLPIPVVYGGVLTFGSLIAAVVISGIALWMAGGRGRFSIGGWIFGSILAGLGVCVMHYGGMYAMGMGADLLFDVPMVVLSVVIAITAAAAALWIAFNVHQMRFRMAAAFIMGVAVCAMHYTGMAAANFICTTAADLPVWTIGGANLPLVVFTTVGLVMTYLLWNLLGRVLEPAAIKPAFKASRSF